MQKHKQIQFFWPCPSPSSAHSSHIPPGIRIQPLHHMNELQAQHLFLRTKLCSILCELSPHPGRMIEVADMHWQRIGLRRAICSRLWRGGRWWVWMLRDYARHLERLWILVWKPWSFSFVVYSRSKQGSQYTILATKDGDERKRQKARKISEEKRASIYIYIPIPVLMPHDRSIINSTHHHL